MVEADKALGIIIIIIIIIIHTPKNLGSKKLREKETKKASGQLDCFPSPTEGSWPVRQHTQITEEMKER